MTSERCPVCRHRHRGSFESTHISTLHDCMKYHSRPVKGCDCLRCKPDQSECQRCGEAL